MSQSFSEEVSFSLLAVTPLWMIYTAHVSHYTCAPDPVATLLLFLCMSAFHSHRQVFFFLTLKNTVCAKAIYGWGGKKKNEILMLKVSLGADMFVWDWRKLFRELERYSGKCGYDFKIRRLPRLARGRPRDISQWWISQFIVFKMLWF